MEQSFLIFIGIAVISLGAIFFVVFSLFKKDSLEESIQSINPTELNQFTDPIPTINEPSPSKSIFKKLFKKKINPEDEEIPQATTFPSLKEYLEAEKKTKVTTVNEPKITSTVNSGTASLKINNSIDNAPTKLTKAEEKTIENEVNLTIELNELKEKNKKLEQLINEKNEELSKTKTTLDNELKDKKEFNKVKDLLEKEIRDSKEEKRKIQLDFNNAKTEAESYQKRIAQLEEKATKLEKEILTKENEIDTLVKKIQVFASPTTASTPLQKEKIVQAPTLEKLPESTIELAPTTDLGDIKQPSSLIEPKNEDSSKNEEQPPSPETNFLKLGPDITKNETENIQNPPQSTDNKTT